MKKLLSILGSVSLISSSLPITVSASISSKQTSNRLDLTIKYAFPTETRISHRYTHLIKKIVESVDSSKQIDEEEQYKAILEKSKLSEDTISKNWKTIELMTESLNKEVGKYSLSKIYSGFTEKDKELFMFQAAVTKSLRNNRPLIMVSSSGDESNPIRSAKVIWSISIDKTDIYKTVYYTGDIITREIDMMKPIELEKFFKKGGAIIGDVGNFKFNKDNLKIDVKTADQNKRFKLSTKNYGVIDYGRRIEANITENDYTHVEPHPTYAINLLAEVGVASVEQLNKYFRTISTEDGYLLRMLRMNDHESSPWFIRTFTEDHWNASLIKLGERDWTKYWLDATIPHEVDPYFKTNGRFRTKTAIYIDSEKEEQWLAFRYDIEVANSKFSNKPFNVIHDFGNKFEFFLK